MLLCLVCQKELANISLTREGRFNSLNLVYAISHLFFISSFPAFRIIRAPDRDLFHYFHEKRCDPNLTKEQYRSCLGSKALAEGTHTQIAMQLTKLREKYEPDSPQDDVD